MRVSVLIPTYNRVTALSATLTALISQTFKDFEIVISDQSDKPVADNYTIQCVREIFELHGNPVQILSNFPRNGIAQQRQFLLGNSSGDFSLFLDDDVILEADVLERMVNTLEQQQCGFVGMALIGLSYKKDVRIREQSIECWEGKVKPETIRPRTKEWERYKLHNAANILHVSEKLQGSHIYKIAWIGGCVLYDTKKLKEVSGFDFWKELPEEHCGEDVLVQLRLMERYGGCGIIPSGAYHQELPTTIQNREVNAPEYFLGK